MASSLAARKESWSSMHHSEVFGEDSDQDQAFDPMDEDESDAADVELASPTPPTLSDLHHSLYPLRAAAERVGKQVEQFAEHLDRYNEQRATRKHTDYHTVIPLVNEYKKIANDTVKYLKGVHPSEKQRNSRGTWDRRLRSSSGRLSSTSSQADQEEDRGVKTTVKDLRIWEQEAQSWDLLASMLQVEFLTPRSGADKLSPHQQSKRPDLDTNFNSFSSEKAAWNRFLAEDDLAWERHTVVEWLQMCADTTGQDIETVVKELEAGADREGLWAHSWMYSKEEIKKQKRLRAWPQALDPDSPGIKIFLTDSNQTEDLITQLDPDAITRQGRNLETQDFYNERAIWLACWEMIRRGKDWSYIQGWCQERGEGWRATAMRGDPRGSSARDTVLANGWQSRRLWRKTCAVAAKKGGVDKYENAVYGALGGYLPSVLKVCGSWNDYLFAHYNSYLLAQFDDYVKEKFPDRILNTSAQKSEAVDFQSSEDHRGQTGKQIVESMKRLDFTKKQATTATKLLQGSLIAKAFKDFVIQQGALLGRGANAQGKSKIIAEPRGKALQTLDNNITAPMGLHDYDMLRTVTHMIFVFQDLGVKIEDTDCLTAAENILAAYIDFLSKAGKQQLLPLYASRLSPTRATDCLARQLPLILGRSERQTVMSLMEQSDLDVPGIVTKQIQLIILDALPRPRGSAAFPQLEVLEPAKDNIGRPRPIKKAFIGDSISDDDQDLINGFQWYTLLEGHWELTMNMGTFIYKHFLRYGSLAAGRELSKNMSFSQISQSKTKHLLGSIVDLSKENEDYDYDERDGHDRANGTNGTLGQSRMDRRYLQLQARSFRDFENLFVALDALERWKDAADRMMSLAMEKPGAVKTLNEERRCLRTTLDDVEASIGSLCEGWLQDPQDEEEATQFEAIRRACLPEVVLAYVEVLNVSARFISRDLLLKNMDLAATVATEDSDLAACFMEAGRMAELVTSFAFSSQGIIRAEEQGGKGARSRRKHDGRSLEIWNTKA